MQPKALLSIIVPTIQGREASLQRAIDAYQATTECPHEFVVVHDEPSWSRGCNVGYERAEGSLLLFAADDLEPVPGWWRGATQLLLGKANEIPAPKVLNHSADGPWDNNGDGADGALTHFTRIPMMRRDQYERIGVWPEVDYASDVWVSEKARTLGIEARMVHSFCFIHHWSQVGRTDQPERLAYSEARLQELRAEL